MKNLYIKPVTRVVALTNDIVLQGLSTEGFETSDFNAKRNNNFSSWDYDFDEEEESESNFLLKLGEGCRDAILAFRFIGCIV